MSGGNTTLAQSPPGDENEGDNFKLIDKIDDPSNNLELLAFLEDETVSLDERKNALNAIDVRGVTPLFIALRKDADYELIEKMVKVGGLEFVLRKNVDLNETVLHEAAKWVSSFEIFKLLIDTATTTDNNPLFETDLFGNTPLHYGTSYGGMLLNIALFYDEYVSCFF